MRYQEYQQKIEKLAKIRKFLFRYRVLFILGIATVLSLVITLMAVSGTVTDTTCPESFVYGSNIDYAASAVMGDVYYEYSTDGVNWTTTAPTEIGTYKVRAVSHGLFGSKRTGAVHEFSILPQSINVIINESSITYGDLPTVSANLSYDDTITCSDFTFYDPTMSSTSVIAKKSAIKITNKDGEDVTSSYDINVISKAITFNKRFITVTVSDKSAVYSNVELTSDGYEISSGTLATIFGDRIQATFDRSIKNVGSIANEPELHIYNPDGIDVSNQYYINKIVGNLTITPKQLLIKTGDYDEYYDGTKHSVKTLEDGLNEGTQLVDGHKLVIVGNAPEVLNIEEGIDNVLVYAVEDENGNDVTSNYNIIVSYGKLKVSPRPITIKSATSTLVYNGELQYDKNIEVTSTLNLVNEDYIKVNQVTKLINNSSAINEIDCSILTKDKVDNSANYAITYEFGTLTISKRLVKIKANTTTFEYNGTYQFDKGYSVISDLNFVEGQNVVIDTFSKIQIVDEIDNILTIHVENAKGEDVSTNYEIYSYPGLLTVIKRITNIESNTSSHTYDGKEYYDDLISGTNIAPNQYIEVLSHTSLTDVVYVGNIVSSIDNVLTYRIIDENEEDVTKYYQITYISGKLTINKRPLSIKGEDKSFVYNDEDFSHTKYSIVDNTSLVDGHEIEVINAATIKEVKDSGKENSFEIKIYAGSIEKTKNYDISYTFGTLTVTKRDITIKAGSDTKVYDSTPLKKDSIELPNGKVNGHIIIWDIAGSQLDVGSSSNLINPETLKIKNASNEVVNDNYNITIEEGTLTVLARPIEITTTSNSWIYDAQDHSDTTWTITDGSLVDASFGHIIVFDASQSFTKVNDVCEDVENEFSVLIQNGSGANKTSNYVITIVPGLLSITPKPITVTSNSKSWTYDSEEHSYAEENVGFTHDDFILGHSISSIVGTKVTYYSDATVNNVITITITNGSKDVTANYLITYNNDGVLTIEKRAITITTNSISVVYDGQEHKGTFLVDNLATNDEIIDTNITLASIIDAGTVSNTASNVKITDIDNSEDRTNNYSISVTPGTLEITKRAISILSATSSHVYDDTEYYDTNTTVTNVADDEGLVSGETIIVTSYSTITNVGSTANTIEVIIKAGEKDTTSNYNIDLTSKGTITVTQRSITITADSKSKTYDGTALTISNDEFTSDNLVSGHIIEVTISGTITDAGTTPSTITACDIKKQTGESTYESVYSNYNVSLIDGTLAVDKLVIAITTDSDEFTYDGLEHYCDTFVKTSDTNFVSGHSLNVITSTKVRDVIYALDGTIISTDNIFTYTISDGVNDYTSNYEIEFTYGTLTVYPVDIEIIADSKSKTYDGKSLQITNTEYSCVSIISGQSISSVTITGKITNVGTTPSIPSNAIILDGESNDVTVNYKIKYTNGTLTITKAALTITTSTPASKVYNGEALSGTYSTLGLISDYDEILAANIELSTLTNVGTVDHKVLSLKITKRVDGSDSTENYDITYITGSLEVLPRPITINSESDSKVYDGEELYNDNFTLETLSDLVSGQVINVLTYTTIRNVGTTENILSFEIKDGEEDVTSNYSITLNKGTLTITSLSITIKANDLTVEYNGEEQSQEDKSEYQITVGEIVKGQEIYEDSLVFNGKRTDIGKYIDEISIELSSIKIYDGEEEVTSNYSITVTPGTLEITKRYIYINTQSKSFTYDGEEHAYDAFGAGYAITSGTLLDGDILSVTSNTKVKTVADGEVDNVLTFSISGPNSSAYEIVVNPTYGKISISKRIIEVTTGSYEGQYDGTEHYNNTYTITSDTTLVDGHTASIDSYTKIIDVAFDENGEVTSIKNIITLKILDGDSNIVTDNYDIQYVTGELKLTQKELLIKSNTDSKQYDGTVLVGQLLEPVATLANNDLINLTFTSIINVTENPVANAVVSIEIYRLEDETHISTINNYIISYELGTLSISKRDIEFAITGGSWVYDGEIHFNSEYTLVDSTDLLVGHEILLETYATIRNVGHITNFISPTIVEEADHNQIVTQNYNIIVNNDTELVVTKAALTIKLTPATFEYNGEEQSSTVISTSGLASSDYVNVTAEGSGKIPGVYDNILVSVDIISSSGEDSYDNYNITLVDGTITITNRAITIESESAHDIYQEGKQYNHNVVNITAGSLANGQILITETVTLAAQYPDGTPNTIVSYDIVDENDNSISYKEYYDVTTSFGTYYIGNPYISIVSASQTAYLDETDGTLSNHTYTINDKLLLTGHKVTVNVTGIREGVGKANNEFTYTITDENDVDVSSLYDIDTTFGILEIKKRTIKITTGSGSWIYDGNEHSSDAISLDIEDLKDGHKLNHTDPSAKITNVGQVTNSVSYSIVDELTGIAIDSDWVVQYYSIELNFGTLEVTGRPIIAQSASDSKVYDGTALTNNRVDILYDGYLLEGHTIQNSVYTSAIGSNEGSSTEKTEVENVIDKTLFIVLDKDGNDVTNIYEIQCKYGILTVYPTEEEEEEDEESKVQITIVSTKTGYVYLKTIAYGEYKKTGANPFNKANPSSNLITIEGKDYSCDYIASLILKEYGISLNTATISSYLWDNQYPLPYYMSPFDGSYNKRTSDALYTDEDSDSAYTVGYYAITMDELRSILALNIELTGELKTDEEAYYAEISDSNYQYMKIDTETKEYMDSIIVNNDLDNSSLSIYQQITAVASFIQSSADYSLSYDSSLDSCDNVAVEFLKTYKIGVCRHFATAATMLYRALGIPARFVIGFVGDITAENTPIDIYLDSYHAWVEVYVQGFGWVQVEVTGGGNIGGYNSEGEEDPEIPELPENLTFTVRPVEVTETYNGQEHKATEIEILGLEEYGGISALNLLGYSFEYELSGSRIIPGTSESSIVDGSFHIYKGVNDITSKCSITYQTNNINVEKAKITLLSSSGSWNYDGQVHSKDSYIIKEGQIAEGDQEYVTCISSIQEIGTVQNDYTYYFLDSNGLNVSSYYEVTKTYGLLEITLIGLTIYTNSDSKVYDGTPLTNTLWTEQDNMIGTVLSNHTIQINITGTITEVGSTENTATVDIIDGEGNSVLEYYAIDLRLGTLTVSSKKIYVYTNNKNKTYDGTPLLGDVDGYSYTEEVLPEDYTIIVTITGKTTGGNAQKAANTCTVIIKNGSDEDATGEFEIEIVEGTLTINPKNLFINTGSSSQYYDGINSVTCPEYTYIEGSGLLSGHSIYTAQNWTVLSTIPEGAELSVNPDGEKYYSVKNKAEFVIVDENNNEITQNYRILETNFGTLSLVLKKIEIASGNREKEYDGTPLTFPTSEDTDYYLMADLFDDHTITATQIGTITEPGVVYNEYQIIVLDGDENDVTYLYDINTLYGQLTVTKRVITIETASDSKKYDGTPLTNSGYNITSGNIIDSLGHKLYVNVTGYALDKTAKNTAICYAYMIENDEEVKLDNLYKIYVVKGTLEIQERKLSISSKGATKEYDATPLKNNSTSQITVHGTACIEPNHTLNYYIADGVAITTVGEIPNTVTYSITDETGADVTYLYVFKEDFGYLVVTPAQIVIETGSKKSNDVSSPLTYDNYTIISGTFYDEYEISVTGEQTGIGQSNNAYEFNSVNKDCYAFTERLGLLVIYDSTNTNYAQVYSSISTTMYLKEASYGEYTKTSWTSAPTYSIMLDSTHSMSYLPSIALSSTTEQNARILAYSEFALPYYMSLSNTTNNQTSDAVNTGSINNEYKVKYYALNYQNVSSLSYSLGDYVNKEQAYRDYVYNNYLTVPSTTATAINASINMSILNPESSAFINNVIDTVKAAGTNDPNYNTAIDSSSDFVASFLGYKKGVSKHFASLATLIFRMLGVPARYTVGAYGPVVANTWSNIPLSNKLSYVEIYIDNLGWIALDVTPAAGESPDDPDDPDDPEELIDITISPVDKEKAYDGTPLTADNALDETEEDIAALLALGYTYIVTVEGSQTEKGTSDSTITSFTLYNSLGEDVTNKYNVTFNTGELKVTNVQILVYLTDYSYKYDGTAHSYGSQEVFWDYDMPTGFSSADYTLSFDVSSISLINAGTIDYDALRACATIMNGSEDVTDSFYLTFDGDGLKVTQSAITITSASASKNYDGTTLTSDKYQITFDKLASGDTIEVTITGAQSTVGSSKNTIEKVVITNSNGEDVTASYNITLVEGTLTLT